MIGPPALAKPFYLIICPPWSRSGSSSIFAAQVEAYAGEGHALAVLVVPHNQAHRVKHRRVWDAVVSDFTFVARQDLYFGQTARRLRRGLCWAHFDWLRAGRDSILAVEERYARKSRIDAALLARVRADGVALIHVNHAFNMGVALRIARVAEEAGHGRPKIMLETHDVQAQRYTQGQQINHLSKRVDELSLLERDESRISGQADALIHISEADVDHFKRALPGRRHFLNRPTSRNQRVDSPPNTAPSIDFLFVGNAHAGNVDSIRWFLGEVMPLLSGHGLAVRIVGNVAEWFRRSSPALYGAYRALWLEEVIDLAEIYAASRFAIVPTTTGSGASIKLIEALAMGKHVVATPLAVAAFARVPGIEEAVRIAADAPRFAEEMVQLARDTDVVNRAGLALYAEHFSHECYRRRTLDIVRGVLAAP